MYSFAFACPERLGGENEKNEHPFAGDIWSLGVTLHVLRYGRFPFPPWKNEYYLQRSIMQGKLELSTPETAEDPVEAVLQGIIEDMLAFDPALRLSATDLLKKLECVFGVPSDATGSHDTSSSRSGLEGDWIDEPELHPRAGLEIRKKSGGLQEGGA